MTKTTQQKQNSLRDQPRAFENNAGFWKGFLFTAVFILLVISFLPVRYETNDDFAIIRRLSDQTGFVSDTHHYSLSYGFGWVLCFLYRCCSSVPWYGAFVYSATYLGASLMLSVVFRSSSGKSLLLWLPALSVFFAHCFSFVSFTAASLMLEFGIFLCVMEWVVRDECPARNSKFYALTLAVGFLMCFSLRWRLVIWSVGLGIPVLFFLRKNHLKKGFLFACTLIMIVVGDRALFHFMTTQEHKAFMAYNKLRAQFHDTINGEFHGETTLKALNKVGWSLDDYAFFRRWILYDDELFNPESLRIFIKENDPREKASIFELIPKRIARSFGASRHCTLALIFSILSLFFYRFHSLLGLSYKDRLRIIGSFGIPVAAIVFFMYYRFPPRVYVPLYAYLLGVTCLLFSLANEKLPGWKKVSTRKNMIMISVSLFMLLTWVQAYAQAKGMLKRLKTSKTEKDYIQKYLNVVRDKTLDSDPLLVSMNPVDGLRLETIHPLKEFLDVADMKIFPAGTGVNSPRYFSILRTMGLQKGHDFLKWMIDRKKVLLVLIARGKQENQVWTYLWESYFSRHVAPGQIVRLAPVYDFRNKGGVGLVFYNFVTLS